MEEAFVAAGEGWCDLSHSVADPTMVDLHLGVYVRRCTQAANRSDSARPREGSVGIEIREKKGGLCADENCPPQHLP